MGCINSKKELTDLNPNLYKVVNVDDEGNALWSGQLGITRWELTLYRKGKDPTTWPIKCLRRYGYDADLFTFEAGRRCATGEGIYAFRCRRAESLFQMLQSYIQLPIDDAQSLDPQPLTINGPIVIPRNNLMTQETLQTPGGYYIMNHATTQNRSPNGTIQSNSNRTRSAEALNVDGNYLDPTPNRAGQISRFQTGLRLGSVSSGPLSPDPHSPGSPSSVTNILEVTQLNPLPFNHPGISNLYQEFPLREHNNNSNIKLDCPPRETAPSLATLRKELLTLKASNDYQDDRFSLMSPISPITVASDVLDNSRNTYINVAVGETQFNQINSGPDTPKIAHTPTTSASIFSISRMNSSHFIDQSRLYENLEPGEMRPMTQLNRLSKPDIFAKVELPVNDKSEPSTPTSHRCNYIVLDLDQISSTASNNANNATSSSGTITCSRPTTATIVATSIGTTISNSSNSTMPKVLLPPDSPKKGILDYATIDFNKTVALSNSTTPSSELDSEGSRKTRHSSVATLGQTKHGNSVSD